MVVNGFIWFSGVRRMKFFLQVAASLMAVISLSVAAQGDPAAGQAKAAICAACHGTDGNSMLAQWPKLAGQHAAYLTRQTNLIKQGARPVPEMVGIIAAVSEQDIEDVSAFFASQNRTGGVADEAQVNTAQRLWRAGNAESGVPACMACHGPAGEGNPLSGYPALAGQHSVYTASMLKRFRSGENWGEKDSSSHVMMGAAAELTDEEINAVSNYIQGLYLAE